MVDRIANQAAADDVFNAGQLICAQNTLFQNTFGPEADNAAQGVVVGCVETQSCEDLIVATRTKKDVVVVVAGEDVFLCITSRVDCLTADQRNLFDTEAQVVEASACQRVIDRAEDSIDAAKGIIRAFQHLIFSIVDKIGIIAILPHHLVGAPIAIEDVGAGVADQRVIVGIAKRIDIVCAAEGEIFDTKAGGIAHRCDDGVGAGEEVIKFFDADIASGVDDVDIITISADQDVITGVTVENVCATVASEHVVFEVARGVDVIKAGQRDVFNAKSLSTEERAWCDGIGDGGQHGIDAAKRIIRTLTDDISRVIDDVRVVSEKCVHQVGAWAAVDSVGTRRGEAADARADEIWCDDVVKICTEDEVHGENWLTWPP